MNNNYPLSDSDMIYDYDKHRYILTTEYALNRLGIDLVSKLGGVRAVNAAASVNALLDVRISLRIYSILYAHNDKQLLEYIIAKSPDARKVLMEAMGQQLLHIVTYGENEKTWLCPEAYSTLLQPISGTNKSMLYRIYRNFLTHIPTYEEGHY